jgi:sarcosine oxidase delta subunit
VRCPWCDHESAGPRALLEHLRDGHGDQVRITEQGGQVFYEMPCPLCDQRHRQRIKKGGDPDFLARHDAQVRLVALDMLVAHLMAEHESALNTALEA